MSFKSLKALRLGNGNIYTFNNYKIYLIPGNKLKLGISPLIDQFINKELDLSIHCKTGVGDIITNKYIYEILKKKKTILFFATKTITKDTELWEDEKIDENLIKKLNSMNLEKNLPFFNKVRNQIGLKPVTIMAIKLSKKLLPNTIKKIEEEINKKNKSYSRSRKSNNSKNLNNSNSVKGGGFITKSISKENLISFMFIEKQTNLDYYIKVRCTSKIIDFEEDLPEYKFPWSTYFLYIFLKSLGNRNINIYNDASSEKVIYYHKRFLFNLGNKKCDESDEIYDKSLEIPFDILRGPDSRNKKLLEDLIKSLPDSYETKSGFRMKLCNIKDRLNLVKIDEIEQYLESKWDKTFNLDEVELSKKSLKSRKTPSSRRRSFTIFSNSDSRSSPKKSKKLSRRHSFNL